MCQFAEDQVIQVPLLAVLWLSIDAKHNPLSGLKVRQWAAQLLSRSILLGSSTDGVAMVREHTNVHSSQSIHRIVINYSFFCFVCSLQHDIVRDFALAAHAPTALQQRQRQLSQGLIDHCTSTNEDRST